MKDQPHDKFFKKVFSNKTIVIEYLTQFLPKKIVEGLVLEQLQLRNDNYVDDKLKEHFSDIVYTCPYRVKGTKVHLCFLLEHKSYPVEYPHFQLLRYILNIWEKQLEQKEDLSLIVPILIYHGEKKWIYRPLEDYFKKLDEPLLRFLPRFDYHLTDLSHYADEEIEQLRISFLINSLLVFKHYKQESYLRQKWKVFFEWRAGANENLMRSLFVYLIKITEIKKEELPLLFEQLPNKVKTSVMSTYDMIIQEGREQGRQQGIEQGIEQGRQQGIELGVEKAKEAFIQNLIQKEFDLITIAELVQLPIEAVKKIKAEME